MFNDEAAILSAAAILAAPEPDFSERRRPGELEGIRSVNPISRLRAVLQEMEKQGLIADIWLQE